MSGAQMMMMGSSGVPLSISGGSTLVTGGSDILGAGSKTVTTSSASVGTVTGGVAPYSYLWQYVSGDSFSANSISSSSSTFSTTLTVSTGQSVTSTGVYRCRVTDALSQVAYGTDCTVEATLTETS